MFSLRNECSITDWKKKKGKKGFYYNQLRAQQAWFQRERRKRCKHDCFTFLIYPFQRNQETVLTASGKMAWPDPNRKVLHKGHYLDKCFKGVTFLKSILIKIKCRGVIYSRIARVREKESYLCIGGGFMHFCHRKQVTLHCLHKSAAAKVTSIQTTKPINHMLISKLYTWDFKKSSLVNLF